MKGALSGIYFSALGPVLSEVVGLKDFSDALSIITLSSTAIAFQLNEYSQNVLGRTGPAIYHIGIGVAVYWVPLHCLSLSGSNARTRTDLSCYEPGCKLVPIGREGDAGNKTNVAEERLDFDASTEVTDPHCATVCPCELLPIGGEGDAPSPVGVTSE